MAEVIAFAGPCLPPDVAKSPAWRRLLDGVEIRPPARRGDVLAALAADPHTILLLDGYYYSVPAVTHKELLYALEAGVRVIGAASMGALRAVELAPWGMIGVGRVYRAFARGEIEGDDEVAVLHLPAQWGYRATTLALVEVRIALARLARLRALPAEGVLELLRQLQQLPFTERRQKVVQDLAGRCLGEAPAAELASCLAAASVKTSDARLALRLARRPPAHLAPPTSPPTSFFSFYREQYFPASRNGGPGLLRAWNAVQLLHPEAPEFVRQVRLRFLLAAAAKEAGLESPLRLVSRRAERLRSELAEALPAPVLPAREIVDEARDQLLADAARGHIGDEEACCRFLAGKLGLSFCKAAEGLLDFLDAEVEQMPAWLLMRAFVFTPSLAPAVAAACAASEVHRCFERWAAGARIAASDLPGIIAKLWGSSPADLPAEATRRGFFPAEEGLPGFQDAVRWIAPAERLPQPINDYPSRRAVLRAAGLTKMRGDQPCST